MASPRAEVANTIRFRRRKGTVSVLEQLAADVTGWPAHAVEFFELLVATQYMNHVRPHAAATTDLAQRGPLELSGTFQAGAFDTFAHTAEMRRIPIAAATTSRTSASSSGACRRSGSRACRSSTSTAPARASASTRSGRTSPCSTHRAPSRTITHLAEPLDVPCRCCAASRRRTWELYGAGRSLLLEVETRGVDAIPAADIRICDLSDDPAARARGFTPRAGDTHVAVDPVLGRVAFAAAPATGETRLATFHYGPALAVGGGGYDRGTTRSSWCTPSCPSPAAARSGPARVGRRRRRRADPGQPDLRRAGDDHHDPAAGERRRPRPVLRSANRRARFRVGPAQPRDGPGHDDVLNGLVLAGAPLVIEESADAETRRLVLRHCTLVPASRATRTAGRTRRPREPDRAAPLPR